MLFLVRFIGQCDPVDFAGIFYRDEGKQIGPDIILSAGDPGIAKTVAAFIAVQRRPGRLPAGVPDRITVFNVVIASALIGWTIIVAVAGQTKKLGIFIEGIAASGIGNQAEEILRAEIIDPGKGCFGSFDDIFLCRIVKMTEFHDECLLFMTKTHVKINRKQYEYVFVLSSLL